MQGIKKGVMELADAIVVNKADGDNLKRALIARSDYDRMLHYIRPATEKWKTQAYTCSAVTKDASMNCGMLSKNSLNKARKMESS